MEKTSPPDEKSDVARPRRIGSGQPPLPDVRADRVAALKMVIALHLEEWGWDMRDLCVAAEYIRDAVILDYPAAVRAEALAAAEDK